MFLVFKNLTYVTEILFILWVSIFGSGLLFQILRNTDCTAVYSMSCLAETFEFIYIIT